MHTHEEKEESSALHLYCRLLVRQRLWFTLHDIYGRYYTATRVGVLRVRSDADADTDADSDADADADEEGEAREGGYVVKEK